MWISTIIFLRAGVQWLIWMRKVRKLVIKDFGNRNFVIAHFQMYFVVFDIVWSQDNLDFFGVQEDTFFFIF